MQTTIARRHRRALRTQRERIDYLIDVILDRPDEWDQGVWALGVDSPRSAAERRSCGTAGCMAGHLATVVPIEQAFGGWVTVGAYAIGLSYRTANYLFGHCFMGTSETSLVRRRRALRMLRWMRTLAHHGRRRISKHTIALFDEGRAKAAIANHAAEVAA